MLGWLVNLVSLAYLPLLIAQVPIWSGVLYMFVRDVPIFVSQTCAFKILTSPRGYGFKLVPRKFTSQKHRKRASRVVHLPISKVFSEVCWCAHTLFSLLSQDSLRDQIQRCAFGRSDLPLGPIDSHGYQALPKSARNGRSLKHKSTHKNSLCDFSSHMAMSETPVPQVIYPKPNPSYLHHISIISPSYLPYFLPDHWFVWHQSQPPAGRTKVPALPSQPGGTQSGTAAGVTKLVVNQAKMEM
jgi:hypothetical protein